MKRQSLIAAVALAAASLSAYAVEGREVVPDRSTSVQTYPGSIRSTAPVTTPTGTLSRDEVKSELRELQSEGLYQDFKEASPSPLDDQKREQQFSQTYGSDRVSQAIAEHDRDALMSLADREDEAPVIIIEAVPQDQATPMGNRGALPEDHPAVRDGSPADEAPQVPVQ